jgi:hypothetical protein
MSTEEREMGKLNIMFLFLWFVVSFGIMAYLFLNGEKSSELLMDSQPMVSMSLPTCLC